VQPKPAEVELWDASGLAAAGQSQPAETMATPSNETPQASIESKEVDEPADIETKASNNQKKSTPLENPNPISDKPKPTKQEVSKTNPINNDAREEQLNKASKTAGSTGSSSDPGYLGKVKDTIERKGRQRGLSGQTGKVSFRVSASGVISGISISNFPADKKSILENVIQASSPLPKGLGGVIPQKVLNEGMSFRVTF
jgi:outer membrane biosynthesis protein TonB